MSDEKSFAELWRDAEADMARALNESMGVEGWEYRDLPRMTVPLMGEFKDIVGEENIKWITFAEYPDEEHGKSVRGQLLISPEGMERLREASKK